MDFLISVWLTITMLQAAFLYTRYSWNILATMTLIVIKPINITMNNNDMMIDFIMI